MSNNREQKLVDIMFQIAFAAAVSMQGKNNDQIAAWVRVQLRASGFEIIPVGSSHGMLQN